MTPDDSLSSLFLAITGLAFIALVILMVLCWGKRRWEKRRK